MGLNEATDSLENNAPKSGGGQQVGQSALEPVGFHGVAPSVKGVLAKVAGTLTGSTDGTINDVAAAAGAGAGTSSPSATNVDTAIATAVADLVTSTNLALKELHVKQNAIIDALVAKGLLSLT